MAKAKTAPATEVGGAPAPGGGVGGAPPPEGLPSDPEPNTEPSAYEQAEAFKPEFFGHLPSDAEVRRLYLAINGDAAAFPRKS